MASGHPLLLATNAYNGSQQINMNRIRRHIYLLLLLALPLSGCTGLPEGVAPVRNFDIQRYLGKWYEIARLDHRFERGMDYVTADYQLREDGGINVTNRGYLKQEDTWKTARGKAYFMGQPTNGYLKVSFFGPFYGSYVIFELDHDDYQYSFVTSHDKSYLWLLSRTPKVSEELMQRFLKRAHQLGYPVEQLIFNEQMPGSNVMEI